MEHFEPVIVEQLFSRKALGFLWAKRDKLDPGQTSILDALYLGRKKGIIDGRIRVEYKLPKTSVGKLGFGRCYGTKGSLETLEREIRGTMCREFYDDVDVKNCHPVILYQLAKNNYQVDLPEVKKYCDNRDEFLSKLSTNKDEAKQTIIKVFYNGKNEHTFLAPMALEIKSFIKNNLMKDDKYEKLLECIRKQDKPNKDGAFLSYILQTEERKVMMSMRESLTQQGHQVDVLAYDGVMIRKGKQLLTKDNLSIAENFIHTNTNYRLELVIKPFQFFEITEEQKDELEEVAPKVTKQDYERNKTIFEENHFYYSTTNEIVEVGPLGELNFESIEHSTIKYVTFDFKHSNNLLDSTSFIKLWIKDPTRRSYRAIDMKPSDDPTIFSPPLIFKYTTFPKAHNEEAIRVFNDLVRILCSNSIEITEYVTKWLAHMIQHPFDNPGTAIIFSGMKGCGKDTIGDFLIEWIVGKSLAHNYDSNRQFWDKHDTSRENRILVKIEEADGCLNRQYVGEMKARITSADITVNQKQKTPRTTGNYNHYIMTTNDGQPVKVEEGERRFNVISCSPEWVGQLDRWREVRRLLFSADGASSIGHYLGEMKLNGFDPRKMPKNEYLEQAIDAELSPEREFLNNWGGEKTDMIHLYELYVNYCIENKMRFASNSKSFGLKLTEHIRDGYCKKERTKQGMMYSK